MAAIFGGRFARRSSCLSLRARASEPPTQLNEGDFSFQLVFRPNSSGSSTSFREKPPRLLMQRRNKFEQNQPKLKSEVTSLPQVRALQDKTVNCSSRGFPTYSHLPSLLPGGNEQQWFWGGQLRPLTQKNHSAWTDNAELLELSDKYRSGIILLYCTVLESKRLDEMTSGDVTIFPAGPLFLPETRTFHRVCAVPGWPSHLITDTQNH